MKSLHATTKLLDFMSNVDGGSLDYKSQVTPLMVTQVAPLYAMEVSEETYRDDFIKELNRYLIEKCPYVDTQLVDLTPLEIYERVKETPSLNLYEVMGFFGHKCIDCLVLDVDPFKS